MNSLLCLLSFGFLVPTCSVTPMVYASNGAYQKEVDCSFKAMPIVRVPYNKLTILSFPTRPVRVISGKESFDIRFIKNDLALKSIRPKSESNLFVYLENETCAFQTRTVPGVGDEIIIVNTKRKPKISFLKLKKLRKKLNRKKRKKKGGTAE